MNDKRMVYRVDTVPYDAWYRLHAQPFPQPYDPEDRVVIVEESDLLGEPSADISGLNTFWCGLLPKRFLIPMPELDADTVREEAKAQWVTERSKQTLSMPGQIVALRAENERLRGSLESIRDFDVDREYGYMDEWTQAAAFTWCQTRATEALKPQQAGGAGRGEETSWRRKKFMVLPSFRRIE